MSALAKQQYLSGIALPSSKPAPLWKQLISTDHESFAAEWTSDTASPVDRALLQSAGFVWEETRSRQVFGALDSLTGTSLAALLAVALPGVLARPSKALYKGSLCHDMWVATLTYRARNSRDRPDHLFSTAENGHPLLAELIGRM